MHAAMRLRCCGYLVIIPVQPTDGSVNMLFDSGVFRLVMLLWVELRNEMSKEIQSFAPPLILVQNDDLDMETYTIDQAGGHVQCIEQPTCSYNIINLVHIRLLWSWLRGLHTLHAAFSSCWRHLLTEVVNR